MTLELAALAAAATSAVPVAVPAAVWETGAFDAPPLSPPHAASANESEMQALPANTRPMRIFDPMRLSRLIVVRKPTGIS
ncbi:hypothetical protein [Paraburkholderia sp. GAS41]|jgi:hypothetical protein|uniref:hypothetical protein n=1 Tax=Paraburkholderia sp. GAS41 TaxID=3035134 RepID=UPI003D262CB1